jgi:hypothetical protein
MCVCVFVCLCASVWVLDSISDNHVTSVFVYEYVYVYVYVPLCMCMCICVYTSGCWTASATTRCVGIWCEGVCLCASICVLYA